MYCEKSDETNHVMKKSLLVAIILIVNSSCSPTTSSESTSQAAEGASELTNLQIGYSKLRISLPVFVAKEQGIFEKNGINAELLVYETAQPLMQALVEDKVQVAGYTALPITYNGMIRSGKELLFLTTMIEDQEHRISYFLKSTNPQVAKKINSIGDLKGKKIGILPTIAYKAWVEEILRQNEIDPDKDVIIQQVAPPQQPQTIKTGGVDALFTNDPAATSSIQLGVATLIDTLVECPAYIMDPFPFGSFNVSRKWADKNPELLKKLAKSLDEAIDFIRSNQIEAKEAMRKYLPESFQAHVQFYPDAKYLKTSESSDSTFNLVSYNYLKTNLIPQELDLRGLVYNPN